MRRSIKIVLPSHLLRMMLVISIGSAVCTMPYAKALAEDDSSVTTIGVPSNIHLVSAGGYWSRGEKEGFYRVIVTAGGTEHVNHRLFLQWIAIDPVTQSYSVVDTRSVEEINGRHGYLLDVKVEFTDQGSMDLQIFARRSRSPQEAHFAITAKGDGSYTVTKR